MPVPGNIVRAWWLRQGSLRPEVEVGDRCFDLLAVFLAEPPHFLQGPLHYGCAYGCALKYVAMLLLPESEHITVQIFRPESCDSICVKDEVHRLGVFHRFDRKKLDCIWMRLCIRIVRGTDAVCRKPVVAPPIIPNIDNGRIIGGRRAVTN